MKSMQTFAGGALVFYLSLTTVSVQAESLVEGYTKRYPYIEMKDTIYTIAGEFTLPDGFHYADTTKLSSFGRWLSDIPIWHDTKQIGSWHGGSAMSHEAVARAVHIPWRGPAYTDAGFVTRLYLEFFHATGRMQEAAFTPTGGDAYTYSHFLNKKMVFNSRGDVMWQEAESPRPDNLESYYAFVASCLTNTSYAGLVRNTRPIDQSELEPGDIFIAHDSVGRKGRAALVVNMVVNNGGERRYAVLTGCERACDPHIAHLSGDRDAPWVPAEKIRDLTPAGAVVVGFYRFVKQ